MTNLIIGLIFLIIIIIGIKILKNSTDENQKNLPDQKSGMYIMNPTFTKTENGVFIFSFSKIDDEGNPEGTNVNISSKKYKRLELVYPYNPYINFEIIFKGNNVTYISVYKKGTFKELKNIEDINRAKLIGNKNIIFLSDYINDKEFQVDPFKMITNDTESTLTIRLIYKDGRENDEITLPPYEDYISYCPHKFTIKII